MQESRRHTLLRIFQAALDAVNGRQRVRDFLARCSLQQPVYLIALGKVACSMAQGAADVLGSGIRAGLVVTKKDYAEPLPWPVLEAAHPVPDESSLAAGRELMRFIDTIPSSGQVLVLLSGGASALVESLPVGIDLIALQRVNEWLLASGQDISAMNRVRKQLSLIKGGRLARAIYPRKSLCLAISDVPGDDPRIIGSGPLVSDDVVDRDSFRDAPPDIKSLLLLGPPVPPATDPCFENVQFKIIARLSDAKEAAKNAAEAAGFLSLNHLEFLQGEAAEVGERLGQSVIESQSGTLHIWGGETTVRLPEQAGRGGRNQSLALSAARVLQGHQALLLAAGTDGSDGPTDDAGALVDGGTIERGKSMGLDADLALRRADAGSFLEASGDLIRTGPTGTNVMDLTLGLRH